MKANKEIAAEFKKRRKLTTSRLSKQYANTKRCQSFYSGDFMDYQDSVDITLANGERKKTLVKFNKVKPYVNAVKGFMAQNRRKPKYEANIENDKLQELFSSYANSISDYSRTNADADQVETQQDGDMLINGIGAVETAMSYGEGHVSHEVDGAILMGRLDPLAVGYDPFAKDTNILDARWVYYCKEYHIDEALQLFNNADEEDFEQATDLDGNEENYAFFPNGGKYDRIAAVDYSDRDTNMVKVYFYQWYDIENYYKAANPIYMFDDPETVAAIDAFLQILANESEDDDFVPRAEMLCYSEDMKAKIEEYFGDLLGDVVELQRKVYYTAVLSGDHVFTAYRSISQQGYTIQFKTGDYDAANGIWTGLVNSMMQPALYYNKALTELMFTIASNSKGGVYYEEDAVDDVVQFERNYAKTDAAIPVANGALAEGRIKDKARPHLNNGLDQIVALADSAMVDVNGFDTTFMGSREFANDTAAFQKQRIKQAMSLLACYFDSVTLYQKRHARIMLDLMRVFVENNQNMAVRVIGEEGKAVFLRLQTKQLSAEYDVVVTEAPLSQQDKQDQANILISMADKVVLSNPQAANVIYASAVDLMPLDFAMRERIRGALLPQDAEEIDPAYVQQLEQQVEQLTDQSRQVQLQSIVASTNLDVARAAETQAKARKAEADTVKTLEDSEQRSIENELMKRTTTENINVNI